jgi:hypothetical protein
VVAYSLVANPRIVDEKATFHRISMANDDLARNFRFSDPLMAGLSAQVYRRTSLRT